MTEARKDRRAPASIKVKYKSANMTEFVELIGGDVSRFADVGPQVVELEWRITAINAMADRLPITKPDGLLMPVGGKLPI